jgi:hypothetical protein
MYLVECHYFNHHGIWRVETMALYKDLDTAIDGMMKDEVPIVLITITQSSSIFYHPQGGDYVKLSHQGIFLTEDEDFNDSVHNVIVVREVEFGEYDSTPNEGVIIRSKYQETSPVLITSPSVEDIIM